MDKRSTGGVAGEWRQQALSGHALSRNKTDRRCRSPYSASMFLPGHLARVRGWVAL
jgi:hypothetical protein